MLSFAARLNLNADHSARLGCDVQVAACAVNSYGLKASIFEKVGDEMLADPTLLLSVYFEQGSAL